MKIEIWQHEGKSYPFLLCDLCGKRIEDAKLAEYLIPHLEEGKSGEAIVGHKDCTMPYEKNLSREERYGLGNMDVEHLLFCLITNTKADFERAKKSQEVFEGIGW